MGVVQTAAMAVEAAGATEPAQCQNEIYTKKQLFAFQFQNARAFLG